MKHDFSVTIEEIEAVIEPVQALYAMCRMMAAEGCKIPSIFRAVKANASSIYPGPAYKNAIIVVIVKCIDDDMKKHAGRGIDNRFRWYRLPFAFISLNRKVRMNAHIMVGMLLGLGFATS
jgi:hypothetical protein